MNSARKVTMPTTHSFFHSWFYDKTAYMSFPGNTMSCLLLSLNFHSDSFNELAWFMEDWVSDVLLYAANICCFYWLMDKTVLVIDRAEYS